jgi:hypothetical protein
LTATPGPNARQVTLTWNANPGSEAISQYVIWRTPWLPTSSTQVGATPLTTFVDTLPLSGQSVRYYIIAIDGGGNQSPASTFVTGTSR